MNNHRLKINNGERGYAIVELLFYISFFAVFVLVVINSMVTMARAFKETSIQSEFLQSGSIMERISREIKQSNSISSIAGTDLTLNTKDSGGADKTVRFVLSGTDIQFYENGASTGNLNSPNISVTALSFTEITTTKGKAIKISISVQSDNDIAGRTNNFYNTIVLRGDY